MLPSDDFMSSSSKFTRLPVPMISFRCPRPRPFGAAGAGVGAGVSTLGLAGASGFVSVVGLPQPASTNRRAQEHMHALIFIGGPFQIEVRTFLLRKTSAVNPL